MHDPWRPQIGPFPNVKFYESILVRAAATRTTTPDPIKLCVKSPPYDPAPLQPAFRIKLGTYQS